MEKTMSTTIGHYFKHLTCTLFVVLGLLGILAPASYAASGAFTFSAATYAVSEGAGNVNITIKRVGGSTGAATISWRTNSVTAAFNQDYTSFSWTTLSFAAGETQKILPVKIINDTLIEPNETFKVSLAYPSTGTTLGTITSAVVTIQDNDTIAIDTTAPTVSLASPATGTTFINAQTVTITASTSDNVGVSKVELYDGATLRATDTTAPYSFAWAITSANNGSHSLTAKAYDAAGNNKVSAAAAVSVNIPVADLNAPTVSLTSPASGATFTSTQTVTISAVAADNIGVSKVEFYDGVTLMGTDTSAPYTFSWTISQEDNGVHVITANAYDVAGNSQKSLSANFEVNIANSPPVTSGPRPIFPGAVGFGITTPAGRGGKIIKVTNLNDSGTGSLRAAIDATGPRIVVFEISGRIKLGSNLTIKNPYITISGQTAPAPGIMITERTVIIQTHDVLVQHLSVRVGDEGKVADGSWDATDALRVYGSSAYNIVIDHVSAGWSIDEILDIGYGVRDVTINNSIFSQPLYNSVHSKGAHGYANIMADNIARVSSIGNLFSGAVARMPRVAGVAILLANNVYYNKGTSGRDFSAIGSGDAKLPSYVTAVGNLWLDGPSGVSGYALKESSTQIQPGSAIYMRDNAYPGGKIYSGSHEVTSPPANTWINGFSYMGDPASVKASVIQKAGTRPAERDVADAGVIADLSKGTGKIINSQIEVGGFPFMEKNVRAFNAGTNPNGDDDGDGYTNIEEILQQMAAKVEGR